MIIRELNAAGVSVQLKFLEAEASRDLVRVLLDGKQIAFHPDMQHNKNYGNLRANCDAIVSQVKAALGKA
eukprot:CAMPEP_0113662928 /NCGR_PEP_ID=MMETSP0038_2-20120614/849_1 /TAXON_ID=2898 /ORGANISM="Cryptomonas paramecium" /LENGTH=69 /DNA_ID=CAMNT_0000577879 /DNA_START=178 /DNA_END=387 /DNA_ORIENTATION=+ /assembly_acc=CAM_ASM_000170